MNKAAYIVAFVCGAVVGAAAWSVYKEKKSQKDEQSQEIDDFDDIPENEETDEEEVTVLTDSGKSAMTQIVDSIITKNGYSVGDHTNDDVDDGPYVIAPDEFGDFEDYDAISMTLTSDGVLLDSDLSKVEDPESNVGINYMKYFGVYPDDPDSVYIRNDDLCCDFEIVKDLRSFEEIDADIPHMKWRDNE